ncbi:MAG TPA: hypothetical protein VFS54_12860 [Solirubrobacterales bacterium]|nr:hypothetical protein [Solirubrobacterales bacterium]
MKIKAETQDQYRWVVALKALSMLIGVAVGTLMYGWMLSPTSVQAGQSEAKFCQITDAQLLADRSHLRGPRVGVQLLANRKSVGAGEVIYARLANFTAKNFISGAEFKVQRYGSSGWETDASSPDGPWPRSAAVLRAGKTRGCYRYSVANDQIGGRYRFLTVLNARSETRIQKFPEVAKFSIRGDGR